MSKQPEFIKYVLLEEWLCKQRDGQSLFEMKAKVEPYDR